MRGNSRGRRASMLDLSRVGVKIRQGRSKPSLNGTEALFCGFCLSELRPQEPLESLTNEY